MPKGDKMTPEEIELDIRHNDYLKKLGETLEEANKVLDEVMNEQAKP